MNFTPSPFDAGIHSIVGRMWEVLTRRLPEPRALIDENDIAQPDGMPFFVISDNGASIFFEGLLMVFSWSSPCATTAPPSSPMASRAMAAHRRVLRQEEDHGDAVEHQPA